MAGYLRYKERWRKQMWTRFDFITDNGLFRFTSPTSSESRAEQPESSWLAPLACGQTDGRDPEDDNGEDGVQDNEESDGEEEYNNLRERRTTIFGDKLPFMLTEAALLIYMYTYLFSPVPLAWADSVIPDRLPVV